MTEKQSSSIDEILDSLFDEESEPTHEALLRWCNRYPEHSQALTDFFATWAVQKELPGDAKVDEARVANLLVSHALDLLHRQRAATRNETKNVPRLCAVIVSKKLTEEEFGSRCGLDDSLIGKLDRRLIHAASVPFICLQKIANILSLEAERVREMFNGPPVLADRYKSRKAPVAKVEDFGDAVRTSDLSEAEKKEWIRLIDSEK